MTEEKLPHIHCQELVEELRSVVGWLFDGLSTPDELRRTVVAFESRKLARFGFALSSSISPDQTVHFSLRCAATGDLCASMDVDPRSGETTVQQAWV